MNRTTNKRWRKKLLVTLSVILLCLSILSIPELYSKLLKAEISTDIEKESIVSIISNSNTSDGNNGNIDSKVAYFLTNQGHIYVVGNTGYADLGLAGQGSAHSLSYKAVKMKNETGTDDMDHVKLASVSKNHSILLTDNGSLYILGSNTDSAFGTYVDNEIKYLPYKIGNVQDFVGTNNIKKIMTTHSNTFILTDQGELYGCGKNDLGQMGLGSADSNIYPFTKIPILDENSKDKSLVDFDANHWDYGGGSPGITVVTDDGYAYTWGAYGYIPTGNYDTALPSIVKTKDANGDLIDVTGIDAVYGSIQGHFILHTVNNEMYACGNWNLYPFSSTDISVANKVELNDRTIAKSTKKITTGFTPSAFLDLNGDYKIMGREAGSATAVNWNQGLIRPPYPLTEENVEDIFAGTDHYYVLYKNGEAYMLKARTNAVEVTFGDIKIKGTKDNQSVYLSDEKYNGSVSLNIANSSVNGEKVMIKKNINGVWTAEEELTSMTLQKTVPEDGIRLYEIDKVYLAGKEGEAAFFTTDLYKSIPKIDLLESNNMIKKGSSISLTAPEDFNSYTAKIIKPGGTIEETYHGETLEQVGSTTLKITDAYGNAKDYTFTVTDNSFAESVSFTPRDEDGLVYGNTITKAGEVIGTLSLVYADGDIPSTIKTLTIGSDSDGPKFEKSGTNQLKVKGTDLNAGTYVVPVSGTDQNDMPFSGEITIVIGKTASTMEWNSDSQKLATDGLVLGKEVTLGVSNQPSGTTVTYAPKTSNSCITLDSTTGKVKVTCVPTPATITFVATPSGNDNYNLTPLELTVPIKKQSVTITIELLDSDASYKNDVIIKIGDSLPTPRITSSDPTLDVSTLGTPTYTYKKNNVVVPNPSITEGIYTVSASYPSGGFAENYDITWIDATLRVDGITIDENNQSDYFTLTNDGKPYTQGTWTNKDIIITPVHDTFNQMSVDDAENKTTSAYPYKIEGNKKVKLSFYNSDGAKVSTTVNLNYDHTAPVLTKFNYEEETSLRSVLRAVTFDHFFGKAQQLSFSGSDEAGGSGLDHYQYEILELDADKNEKPASKKTGTLGLNEKLNLSINTSYRISAWAVDVAGNESDEKIERVYLSDEVAQLNITATSDGKAYDGSTWTKSGVTVKLSSTSNAGMEKYQYSSDGVVFHDLSGDTITLPDPISDLDNVTYTFRAIHNDKTEADKTLNLKVDTVKPELNITGTVNGSPYDGSLADQNIELTMHQTNTNISGSTLYYTTSPTSKDTDPKTDSNWKRYTAPITHSANGTFTYYFKAISGAGIGSDPKEYTVKLAKKEYTNITVSVTSEGKLYSPGNWAKGDVTFTLSGGLKDTTQITGYEYTTTNGSKPTASSTWKPVTNKTLKLTNSVKDQTYWFRVTPVDPDGKMSAGTKVNLDVEAPSIPVMTCEEINTSRVAQFINLFSFGNWMNKQAEVTMTSHDTMSGIDHYEYIEIENGNESKPKSSNGKVTYGDETELTLKARACDKAGNCSTYTSAEEVKIDMKAPVITGVKDQNEYKQYYLPRFVTVTDLVSGLKQATYQKDNTPTGTFTDKEETPIRGVGAYEIYAVDEAGNEVTLTFRIVKLPNIDTEIDGSDESRDIIDEIIKELDEVKGKIDQNEKDNYEQWIKDAEEKWDSLRKKVVEDDKTTSKIEGQGDITFDPKTELIVEEIPKDQVPVLPRNAIKTYDVYLKKGNTVIQPDGSVKVYLPYTEKETPIVYEINDDGTIMELPAQIENGFVTFITDTLKKYAISNTAQKENKPNVCVIGPDGKLDSNDDVCGEGNGSGVPPVKEEDGSVTVPDGGKVIFPDKELDAPDGATINPDGSVDFPDGTHYDPNGNETKKPDPTPNPDDGKNEQVCVAGPDGKLGTADDVCGEGNSTKDPDKGSDGSVTVPDGGSVIFPDGNEVELPDGGIIKPDGSVELPDGSTIDKDGNKKPKVCEIKDGIILNKDSDGDGLPDLNLDIDNDCSPDLNIDFDNDGIPDFNIDSTGDGKADVNVDHDNDGFVDQNAIKLNQWIPNLNSKVNSFAYDTMSTDDIKANSDEVKAPTTNDNQNGSSSNTTNGTDTKGNGTYHNNASVGGAGTGDTTKWTIWGILVALTLCTLGFTLYKKHKQKISK